MYGRYVTHAQDRRAYMGLVKKPEGKECTWEAYAEVGE
jgi:hypothetical protein